MRRLFVNQSGNEMGKGRQERLIVNRANVRISILQVDSSDPLQIKPTIYEDLLEFFMIMEGKAVIESGGFKVELDQGEYFYTHNLREAVIVSAVDTVRFLFASNVSITKQMSFSNPKDGEKRIPGGGLYIMGKGCINRASHDNNALSLLASGGGLDIMLEEIFGRRPGCVTPGDAPDLLEFFYILNGTFQLNDGESSYNLVPGDSFYVYDLDHTMSFTAEDSAKVLYIASKPIFDYLLDFMADLNKLLKQYEQKDVYTHNHSIRVEQYSLKIAARMGLSNDRLLTLAVASLFHDIGKIFIPDEILNKVEKLTEMDYEYIRKHPSDSGKMLGSRFEQELTSIVEQHHERLDGSGYPNGLKAEEIKLEAKIIAIADSFDAMTSDRAYRKGMLPKDAIAELLSMSGTLYDEDAVCTLRDILVDEERIVI